MKKLICLLLAVVLPPLFQAASAADVSLVGVAKMVQYQQGLSGAPVTVDPPYQFATLVNAANGAVLSGELKLPSGTVKPLQSWPDEPPSLEESFSTVQAMTSVYGAGTYTVKLVTAHDGTREFPIDFPAGTLPAAPVVGDPARLMAIDPSADFEVRWNGLGGTASDYAQVWIANTDGNRVLQTPEPGEPGALNGTSTAFTIPRGTLSAGTSYRLRILYAKVVTLVPGYATAIAVRASSTTLVMAAVGTVVDVGQVGLVEGALFTQGTSGAPVAANPPFEFNLFVDSNNSGVVDGSLKFPNGSTVNMPSQLPYDAPSIHSGFPSVQAMTAAYPPGAYTVTLNTVHNGSKTFPFTLGQPVFPPAPVLLNPAALLAVDPAAPLTVSWSPFPGGSAEEYVQVSVDTSDDNSVYQSPQPGSPAALNGTATSFTLPAYAMSTGSDYVVRVLRATATATQSGGTLLISGTFAQTSAAIRTTGPSSAPVLTIKQVDAFRFQLHATGQTGRNYQIESNTNLANPAGWQPMVNYQGSAAGFDFVDGVVSEQRYYRVRTVN